VEKVSELLSRYQVDGRYLEFELTERSFIENMDAVRRELSGLTQLNILLSIDDFGTGYSSLQYLERLPASAIKVDQSFIRNLRADSGAAEIVRAAVRLAHGMKMQVVAEGVETAECYQFLRSLGCDFAQGYHIARPMPAEEFTALVNGHQGIIPVATETPETPDPAEQAPAAHL
jgi:EAL domain-containing protein (putative c-di-GMP-specific phosphodiesterase class I)